MGLVVWHLFIIILLIGVGSQIASDYSIGELQNVTGSSLSDLDASDLNIFQNFYIAIYGLPLWLNLLLLLPTVAMILVTAMWIRGVQ